MATVDSYLNSAQTHADSYAETAQAALDSAIHSVENIGYIALSYDPTTLPDAPEAGIDLTLPTFSDVNLEVPQEPADILAFQDIPALTVETLPTFNEPSPSYTDPNKPSQLAGFNQTAPTVNTSIVFPEPPSQLTEPILDAPTLPSRVEPTAPQVPIPAFTSVAPVDNSVAPTNLDATFANAFATANPQMVSMINGYVDDMLAKRNPQYAAQMAAIEAQLTKYMAGGTGLNAAAENAIYERARSKTDAEARRVRDQALADAAARGFTIPGGALLSSIQQARQAGADNSAAAAREIVVMQAEMEQKNLQFAVTTSANLRTTVLNATLSYMQNLSTINGQALEYAKSIVNSIIEVYNTAVKIFSVKLEAYKADAAVYEAKMRGAMMGVEIYKAEIQALEALVSVDKAKVEVYRARIEALVGLANVYKAQVDAVQGKVSMEKLKLEIFQSQVQAYTSQVQAKNAEWQGYSAAINGEKAKAEIYATKAQAYSAQISGYKTKIDAQAEAIKAAALTNEARAKQYQAKLEGYRTIVNARGDVARTKLENQRQTVVAYQAKVQAQIGNAQVAQTYYKVTSDAAIRNGEIAIKAGIASAESKRAYADSIARLSNANASIFGQLASSSLAGMNTLVGKWNPNDV